MRTLLPIRPSTLRPSLFDEFFGELQNATTNPRRFAPTLDVTETEDAFTVRLEVPGVPVDAIEIEYLEDRLTVRGEKKHEETTETPTGAHVRESRWGAFERSVRFGAPVDSENVEADLEHGVLVIRLPKAAVAKPTRIEVKKNGS